jgi:Icc-related predicted phosphoesterase
VRLGKTLALNPGSSYEEGVLQAAVVNVDTNKHKIKNYILVNG